MEFGDRICVLACRATALAMFCADSSGKLVFANPSVADIIGCPLDVLRARNAGDLLVDGWPPAPPSADGSAETLLLFRRTDGGTTPVFCSLVLLSRQALVQGGCEPGADLDLPLFFVVGHPEPLTSAGTARAGEDASISPEYSAQCRHALLNAISPVKTAANAFVDILRAWASERDGGASQNTEVVLELASALEMGADQLEQAILDLFPRPPGEESFGRVWGAAGPDR